MSKTDKENEGMGTLMKNLAVIIGIVSAVIGGVASYYTGKAQMQDEISTLRLEFNQEVTKLKVKQDELVKQLEEQTKELKANNENQEKLYRILSARFGEPIN